MFKSTMTSKGQLTVPKEIREYLNLHAGDGVIFEVKGDKVLFDKDYEIIQCPVCEGFGSFNFNNLPCFICDQTKYINSKQSSWQLISLIKLNKYGVAMSVSSHEVGPEGELEFRHIPKVELFSKKYPDVLLNIACDYLQMRFIEEFAPRSLSDPEKFMIPSDGELKDILALLKREVVKNEVEAWFRGKRSFGN
ncbi:AbrB/MazE/SpoVT family DNA-binding domain-containing protein [Paenibacillus terreus]|uniref:AbrB/MazE/SpoVT family DNA-binding domain-containing protein n=1 Tax=Paenibacillus terreus TaxID=1387834 RepID=UPI0035CCF220